MRYAYFPGCSAESTARDLYLSTLAVARGLGIEFVEPGGWTCCGTTMAHQVDHDLSLSLAAANLLKVPTAIMTATDILAGARSTSRTATTPSSFWTLRPVKPDRSFFYQKIWKRLHTKLAPEAGRSWDFSWDAGMVILAGQDRGVSSYAVGPR